jgi:hypothetical protein
MKKLLIIALMLFATGAFAQKGSTDLNIPVTAGGIVYEKVFDAPGLSKNLLYSNARVFFIKQYQDKYGNKMQDSTLYRIVGRDNQCVTIDKKGFLNVSPTYDLDFILQVDCKDNKYRVRIYNIVLSDNITPATGGPAVHTLTSAEDMYAAYAAGKGTINYTKGNIKDFFTAVDMMVNNELLAVQNTMADKDDF